MCSHYESVDDLSQPRRIYPSLKEPDQQWRKQMYPGYPGLFLRRPPELSSGDDAVPPIEAQVGRWGMIAPGTKPDKLPEAYKLQTFNARAETVDSRWSFRSAWKKNQRCLIPATAFYEPDWRTGKSVPTRFVRTDGGQMMIAGLWDTYRDEAGSIRLSYTMLTIDAAEHPLLRHYHRPGKEKRMIVVLPGGAYDAWLDARLEDCRSVLQPYPAELLSATPAANA